MFQVLLDWCCHQGKFQHFFSLLLLCGKSLCVKGHVDPESQTVPFKRRQGFSPDHPLAVWKARATPTLDA